MTVVFALELTHKLYDTCLFFMIMVIEQRKIFF